MAPLPIAAGRLSCAGGAGFALGAAALVELVFAFFLAQAAIELLHDPRNRAVWPWAPLAGLVVVFWMAFPVIDHKQRFIKRVVAGPGDRIRLHNKQLVRNGDEVSEPYAIHSSSAIDPFRDNIPAPRPSTSPAHEKKCRGTSIEAS